MEYSRFINEHYPPSTKIGDNPDFVKDRVKELKSLSEVNLEVDGVIGKHSVKVLKVTKAKLAWDKDNSMWHFSGKAVLRLLD